MVIKRKHIGNPKNYWDIEIERERHETVEDNGNLVIDDRKRIMYLIKKQSYYGSRKNN